MSMGQAIQAVVRKYSEFGGRATRPEFWWWVLFIALISAALGTFPTWTFEFTTGSFSSGAGLSALWGIVILVPSLAVSVRRLRDAGFDWAHIFWLLVPVAGPIVLLVLCAQPPRERVDAMATASDVPGADGQARAG
jgi:uncharacterized membrane protein YhaH (DUF805 family)